MKSGKSGRKIIPREEHTLMNPENQFDFWLGDWEAAWGADGKGSNHVERILDGKVVQEDFNAPDLHGLSFSVYDPERKLWCQT